MKLSSPISASSHGFMFHKFLYLSITMRKIKSYIPDVQNIIAFKKRARAVKIPISTIRAIINNFQSN